MRRRREDGTTDAEHWAFFAKQGDRRAIAILTPPDAPWELDYLRQWAYQLHGRSGASMNGPLPVSHCEIEAWAHLRDITITPAEIDAVVRLEGVLHERQADDAKPTTSGTPMAPQGWG